MRFREVFRFEVAYQLRRWSFWLHAAAFLGLALLAMRNAALDARAGEVHFNAPVAIMGATVFAGMFALLVGAALAADGATRDARTRMEPLLHAAPVSNVAYLGGRFLAAFFLTALLLATVPVGMALAARFAGLDPALVGPFRLAAHLEAYALVALPNAFVTTAVMFALAAWTRRPAASYAGGALLFVGSVFDAEFVAGHLGSWRLAKLLDPLAIVVLRERTAAWTSAEKNALLIGVDGPLLWNRLAWLAAAVALLALVGARFRFARRAPAAARKSGPEVPGITRDAPIAVPRVRGSSGPASRLRQVLAVAQDSLREIATPRWALALACAAALLVALGPELMEHLGVPIVPTTGRVLAVLSKPGLAIGIVPALLTVLYAGALVWRERDAALRDLADAMPVPDWVLLTGKFLALAAMLAALQALLMTGGVSIQALLGYHRFEFGLYARVLFGLQLADHLLFAALALSVHILVDHKYAGHLVVLLAYLFATSAAALGIDHNLLVYGSDLGWEYSALRGFEPFVAPFLWFKLYWTGWALLLVVAARLFWVRGRELGFRERLRLARRRLAGRTAAGAAAAATLVLALGGFVFYNTNVLNDYHTAEERVERRVEYERRYGRYEGVPQPQVTGARLRVEIYPGQREVDVRGEYRLENHTGVAIDTIHLATASEVVTGTVRFDRRARLALSDDELGHRVYALERPLQPGDSLRLDFRVRFAPRGFSNRGVDPSAAANGTHFVNQDWLPAVGYQPNRELDAPRARREHGLPPRPVFPSPDDPRVREEVAGRERIRFEAVIGTAADQITAAPGTLRRTWTENGRRYFHYAAAAPIRNVYAVASARYAVREARWGDVRILVLHHPEHARGVDRMIRAARASLARFSELYGRYPYEELRLVEVPGTDVGATAYAGMITYTEGFALLDAERDRRGLDLPFAVVAHEIAHQWWGHRLTPAHAEGAPLLTESLAWYSALGVVEETYGREHLRRLLGLMREAYLTPRARASVPLIRMTDDFLAYRKGPFAMYALREYVGEARVDAALRRLLAAHGSGEPPLPTSLDLYRELREITPDSLNTLLEDLFARNTYWELATTEARVEPAPGGAWRVTLDVTARKVAVDTAGVETELPMNDPVEIGVFAARGKEGDPGAPLYLRRHRIRSGEQTVTVTVPREPARAGIDPRHLLIDPETGDNTAALRLER